MITPFVASLSLVSLVAAQIPSVRPKYPPGCYGATFPDHQRCNELGWDLGPNAVDPCAPEGPYPIVGQQVYIQDPLNFCMNLPDPNSQVLKNVFYDLGRLPTIVSGEGYLQSYCVGSYLTPGALPMPPNAIRAAHVVRNVHPNGKRYIEISGYMDCDALRINCTGSAPGAYDDGGQYDTVEFRKCGKSPYSGVDASRHPTFPHYNHQAGNGLFCMRICEPGMEMEDPCNVKLDTAGCQVTMGIRFRDGFSYTDRLTGESRTFDVTLPPLTRTTSVVGSAGPTTVGSPAAASSSSSPGSKSDASSLKVTEWIVSLLASLALF